MPYSLNEEQIDFILNDIRESGVTIEKLQINLLDHICCIMEQEMKEGENFETVYQNIKKQVFENNLIEIEEETINLLRFKHYYKMKRILYIILFLSIGYNVYVFSKIGYEYYEEKQWMSEWHSFEKVTLNEGYQELVEQLKEKYPEALKKDYLCISFVGDPMSAYERKHFLGWWDFGDSSEIHLRKLNHLKDLKRLDSVAALYSKNVTHVFAYKRSDEYVAKAIDENKRLFKNVIFVDGQKKLFAGHNNDKKQKSGLIQAYFVLDKNGKIVYDCKYIDKQYVFLAHFLKTLPN